MKIVSSIETVELEDIIDTACKPARLLCSDFNFYICKYNAGFTTPDRLLREYLSVKFLQLWNVPTPNAAFIKVLKEHITVKLGIPFKYFDNTCFGSQKLENAIDVTSFLSEISNYHKNKIRNKYDYLKIAFFDIWVGNDDRNHNNYNLLLQAEEGTYRFVPIDHEKVFNTGNLEKPLYPITEESSLILAPLFNRLFTIKELTSRERLNNLKDDLYLCIKECIVGAPEILAAIPADWHFDTDDLQERLNRYLFTNQWIDECWQVFLSYVQLAINTIENKRS